MLATHGFAEDHRGERERVADDPEDAEKERSAARCASGPRREERAATATATANTIALDG